MAETIRITMALPIDPKDLEIAEGTASVHNGLEMYLFYSKFTGSTKIFLKETGGAI